MSRAFRSSSIRSSAVLVALAAGRAHAAPPELLSQLGLHPTDPDRIVLAYAQGGQGLLFSDDGGNSFSLRCGAAVSASFTQSRAPLALTGDGQVLLGTFEGLVRGGMDGCNFTDDVELAGVQVADLAPHPTDPGVTFLATANASGGERTGLVRRDADATFTELGANDTESAEHPAVAMTRLAVAALPSGRLRFVATALAGDGAGDVRSILRVSDDEGSTWLDHEVPDAGGARVLLIGVDPTDPERIAVAISRDDASDRVLMSGDAGQHFEPVLELFELGASAVAPDGRLWIGDAGGDAEYSQPGGLYLFEQFGAVPQKLAVYPVRCLGYRAIDGALLGCQRSTFGHIDPESGAFSVTAGLTTVGGFVSCGPEALAAVCKPQLCANWCGVLHYASAPLCDAYDEREPLCGPAARGYALASPSSMLEAPGGGGPPATGSGSGPRPEDEAENEAPNEAGRGRTPDTAAACQIEPRNPRVSFGAHAALSAAAVLLGLGRRRARNSRHDTCNPGRARCH